MKHRRRLESCRSFCSIFYQGRAFSRSQVFSGSMSSEASVVGQPGREMTVRFGYRVFLRQRIIAVHNQGR
jgi:hypothetical protein